MGKMQHQLTRRGFIKSAAAVGGVAALYGCSKDDNGDVIYSGTTGGGSIVETPVKETVFIGTSPHNCGGGACVLAAHVAGGRVVRYTTDDRPGTDMIDSMPYCDSQRRGCVRCRSKKEWLYRTDRLLYPLKQTGKRGDLAGFKRISWKQAYEEIALEIKRIYDTYGPESFHKFYSTGDGATYPRSREITANIFFDLGGEYSYHDDYSYPSWYTAGHFTWGSSYPAANSAPDLKNTKLIVLWSANVSEMINNCNCSWYLTQARDMGAPVIAVDQRLSKTATTLATGTANVPAVVTPTGGTDSALIAAILYHLIKKHIEVKQGSDIWSDSQYLKPRHITKYIHGFFDTLPGSGDGSTYSYRAGIDNTNYTVADGGSYSAYIFGSEKIDFNNKASIYPNQIGYHTSGDEFIQADGTKAVDPIHAKYAPCYGQIPKTPEWAEKITGVKADTIKKFAELLAANFGQLSLLHCGGFQRNTEGEQNPRSIMVLATVLGAFGKPGATFGNASAAAAIVETDLPSFSVPYQDGDNSHLGSKGAIQWQDGSLKSNIKAGTGLTKSQAYFNISAKFDDTKLTSSVSNKEGTNSSFPVFMWQDAIEKGAYGLTAPKSRWGTPDVAKGPAIKLIFNFGGNCVVNQCGDYNLTTKILSLANAQNIAKDANYPNRQYQLELLISSDHFMTSSCQWSDYVLPASMAFERSFYKATDDAVHFSPKAVDAPGEVRSDFDMTIGIADALAANGQTMHNMTYGGIKTEDSLLKAMYKAPTTGDYKDISYDEFKKLGVITSGKNGSINIPFKAFFADPASNQLNTPTGKVEAYSQGMSEYYEARGFNNIDASVSLVNGTMSTKGFSNEAKGRIVYPIPMYIPLVEGRHACDNDDSVPAFGGMATSTIDASKAFGATKHPDLTDSNSKGYTFRLHTWHMQYRSHSTLNSNAYLNECYKLDKKGKPAFYALDRGQKKVYGENGAICDDGVYEPVFISPKTAAAISLPLNGSRVIIYNDRGAMYAYAKSSTLVQDGEIMIGQGSWASVLSETFTTPITNKTHKIDVGGCANTLISIRPSRICQGMTLANDCKVGIQVR